MTKWNKSRGNVWGIIFRQYDENDEVEHEGSVHLENPPEDLKHNRQATQNVAERFSSKEVHLAKREGRAIRFRFFVQRITPLLIIAFVIYLLLNS